MHLCLLSAAAFSTALGLLFIVMGTQVIQNSEREPSHDHQQHVNISFGPDENFRNEIVKFSKTYQFADASAPGLPVVIIDKDWDKIITSMGDVIVDLSRGNIKKAVDTILTTVLGPYGSLISKIFGLGSSSAAPYREILDKLDQIETELDSIQTKLDKIVDEITRNEVRLKFREVIKSVDYLRETYSKFSKNPDSFTTTLLERCDKQDMGEQLFWLQKEMTDSSDLSLVTLVLKTMNLNFFHSVSIQVVATATMASSLHIACLHTKAVVEGQGTPSKEDMIKLQVEEKDAAKKLKDICNAISEGEKRIKEGFMDQVHKDTIELMQKFPNVGHSEFAHLLFKFLSDKYYWRGWFVGSYNGNTRDWPQHAISTRGKRAFNIIRKYERCLLVATPESPSSTTVQRVQKFLQPHTFWAGVTDEWPAACRELRDTMARVTGDFAMVACVHFGNGLRATMNRSPEEGVIFKNVGLHYFGYTSSGYKQMDIRDENEVSTSLKYSLIWAS